MKKVLIILTIIIALIGLAIWAPWYRWNFNFLSLFGIENVEKYSDLKVKSLSGEIEIYVDKEFKGSVTDNEDFADITLKVGDHAIELKRRSPANYYSFNETITFEQGVEVDVAYDLGPSETFSEGYVFYTKKNFTNDGKPKLNIYSAPDMTKVFIDDIFIGESPLRSIDLDISKQHTVKFQKDGYDDLVFTILPENIEDRQKLVNFDLIIETKLFLQPVKIIVN
jgi:hypothetical protein